MCTCAIHCIPNFCISFPPPSHPPSLSQVKKLFPGFMPNTILRFSSLLGPPKISIGAKLWAGAKRPQKKPQVERGEGGGWKLNFGPTPPPDMLLDDDEVCCYWNCASTPCLPVCH